MNIPQASTKLPAIELRCLHCGALLEYETEIEDGKLIYLIDECVVCAQEESLNEDE